jgi:glycine hydroxymethyltransferase
MPQNETEVHDSEILAQARTVLDACRSAEEMQQEVLDAVARNEDWRGQRCINLLAPEAPTSPTARALLSSEVGIRAAEGHIGAVNRWFVGTQHIDEIEALCIELLKRVFRRRYADHRLMGSMLGNMTVYAALTEPGDVIMSVAQPFGGHSSNRLDGPAGVRGLKVIDVPFDPVELEVDLDMFRKMAPLVRPKLVSLGLSMTLFPFPVSDVAEIVADYYILVHLQRQRRFAFILQQGWLSDCCGCCPQLQEAAICNPRNQFVPSILALRCHYSLQAYAYRFSHPPAWIVGQPLKSRQCL